MKNKRLFLILAILLTPILYVCLLIILNMVARYDVSIYFLKSEIMTIIWVLLSCLGVIFMIYGTTNVDIVWRIFIIIGYLIYLAIGVFFILGLYIMCIMGDCI